jgi:hypothetical protein
MEQLLQTICQVEKQARIQARSAINHTMVANYWEIARSIVEHE